MTTSARLETENTSTPGTESVTVYRHYDADHVLIYVGCSGHGHQRHVHQSRVETWWPFVARTEVEHFSDRGEAIRREDELIRLHRPPFNTAQNPEQQVARAVYMRYRDQPEDVIDLREDWPAVPDRREQSVAQAVADNMRTHRYRLRLRQVDLGRRMGLAQSTISAMEAGTRSIEVGHLVPMCRALGISLDELLQGIHPDDKLILGGAQSALK